MKMEEKTLTAEDAIAFLIGFNNQLKENARTTARAISEEINEIIRANPTTFSNHRVIGFYLDSIEPNLSSATMNKTDFKFKESLDSMIDHCFGYSYFFDTYFCLHRSKFGETPKKDVAVLAKALEELKYTCIKAPATSTKETNAARLLIAFEVPLQE